MTRVLFLDIDGVLNSEFTYITDHDHPDNIWCDRECFSRSSLETLEKIVLECKIDKVILSSVWRYGWGTNTESEKILRHILPQFNVQIAGITPRMGMATRGKEIRSWLKKNPTEDFLIIDDDADMEELVSHLLQTNWRVGLISSDFEKARRILKL